MTDGRSHVWLELFEVYLSVSVDWPIFSLDIPIDSVRRDNWYWTTIDSKSYSKQRRNNNLTRDLKDWRSIEWDRVHREPSLLWSILSSRYRSIDCAIEPDAYSIEWCEYYAQESSVVISDDALVSIFNKKERERERKRMNGREEKPLERNLYLERILCFPRESGNVEWDSSLHLLLLVINLDERERVRMVKTKETERWSHRQETMESLSERFRWLSNNSLSLSSIDQFFKTKKKMKERCDERERERDFWLRKRSSSLSRSVSNRLRRYSFNSIW